MYDEGVRLARLSALKLLQELEVAFPPSPIESALRHFGLQQHFLSRQEELPFIDLPPGVRGALDVPDKSIYVIEGRGVRRRWAGVHEIGHFCLPEHRQLLSFCSVWDLSPLARKQLEREANEFTATFLFQGTAFLRECLALEFSLEMLRNQAIRWHVSFESAFRRYVEGHPQSVALAVCEPIRWQLPGRSSDFQGRIQAGARLRYWSASQSFRRNLGIPEVGQLFEPEHPIAQTMQAGPEELYGDVDYGHRGLRLPLALCFNGYLALALIGLERGFRQGAESAGSGNAALGPISMPGADRPNHIGTPAQ
jgi:hypothetical protein